MVVVLLDAPPVKRQGCLSIADTMPDNIQMVPYISQGVPVKIQTPLDRKNVPKDGFFDDT